MLQCLKASPAYLLLTRPHFHHTVRLILGTTIFGVLSKLRKCWSSAFPKPHTCHRCSSCVLLRVMLHLAVMAALLDVEVKWEAGTKKRVKLMMRLWGAGAAAVWILLHMCQMSTVSKTLKPGCQTSVHSPRMATNNLKWATPVRLCMCRLCLLLPAAPIQGQHIGPYLTLSLAHHTSYPTPSLLVIYLHFLV